jgi:hypothetical protein
MANNKALINYYAKLIHRNIKTIDVVPEYLRKEVLKKEATLPPVEPDPITETPAEEDKIVEESE